MYDLYLIIKKDNRREYQQWKIHQCILLRNCKYFSNPLGCLTFKLFWHFISILSKRELNIWWIFLLSDSRSCHYSIYQKKGPVIILDSTCIIKLINRLIFACLGYWVTLSKSYNGKAWATWISYKFVEINCILWLGLCGYHFFHFCKNVMTQLPKGNAKKFQEKRKREILNFREHGLKPQGEKPWCRSCNSLSCSKKYGYVFGYWYGTVVRQFKKN